MDSSLSDSRSTDQAFPEQADLLVIGGGIVGAGVARDAAMRGLRTCVIDQQDFSAGTSSRSSRLLHGGIRYLAQARIGLVRESSREKMVLSRIAPHLTEPLAFIFPTRRHSHWSRWKLSLGVRLYDVLCGNGNLGVSSVMSEPQTLKLLPGLCSENLTGSVRYYDGLTSDARLTLDTLRSAQQHGAMVANYVKFVDSHYRGEAWHCVLQNQESQVSYEVAAKCVVNATGPWSPGIPHSKANLRLTKGVHLVVDRARFPVPDAVVLAEDYRILFAIPWGNRVILGTTDTDYEGPLGSPTCDPEDQQYVLDVVNSAFPKACLTATDIISTWAGLRPLVADKHGRPSDISRRHEITMNHPGWWDVTGGKLTSYRLMAEETIDAVVRFLGLSNSTCRTAQVPLLESGQCDTVSGVLPPPVSREVVQHYCRAEWARHLDDVMVRRTSWRYYHIDHLAIAQTVAEWMANELGWDSVRTNSELAQYEHLTNSLAKPAPQVCEKSSREHPLQTQPSLP